MSSQIFRSASRAARTLLSSSRTSSSVGQWRTVAAATATVARGSARSLSSFCDKADLKSTSMGWLYGALAVPAGVYMLQDQQLQAAELERTFIAIKPDGVQRGLIAEIISRFEKKGFKLVAIKIMIPSKDFAQKHYHDLKERPFFNGLCDFLSSGPVVAMVWEGEGVIKYGRKLIGATDPQKSEPGTIRGDLAVGVGRNIIHGSDGSETAKDEIALWFTPRELVSYTSNAEKWIYGIN
ncbi:nucleoside diphosphate kinase 3-like [Zingiber officinale]|uniref:nucleoside diphosphate kinase 3-like n=1 Tax=Zingiber officinale TaxID=94328 RepID=UPI001C4B7CA3|nr:nucleoside diphosphate kinase 3-like [Zingiber officinale]